MDIRIDGRQQGARALLPFFRGVAAAADPAHPGRALACRPDTSTLPPPRDNPRSDMDKDAATARVRAEPPASSRHIGREKTCIMQRV